MARSAATSRATATAGTGGIAVDAQGDAYVTGTAGSPDFPTKHAVQGVLRGNDDAFVAELSPGGRRLDYSTYLGGSDADSGASVAIDARGAAYVTGLTLSSDFPSAHAPQGSLRGFLDAFVVKLSPSGRRIGYATYLGGSGRDLGNSVAVDAEGAAYVTGFTDSTDFPTRNALQAVATASAGEDDAFVAKLTGAAAPLSRRCHGQTATILGTAETTGCEARAATTSSSALAATT